MEYNEPPPRVSAAAAATATADEIVQMQMDYKTGSNLNAGDNSVTNATAAPPTVASCSPANVSALSTPAGSPQRLYEEVYQLQQQQTISDTNNTLLTCSVVGGDPIGAAVTPTTTTTTSCEFVQTIAYHSPTTTTTTNIQRYSQEATTTPTPTATPKGSPINCIANHTIPDSWNENQSPPPTTTTTTTTATPQQQSQSGEATTTITTSALLLLQTSSHTSPTHSTTTTTTTTTLGAIALTTSQSSLRGSPILTTTTTTAAVAYDDNIATTPSNNNNNNTNSNASGLLLVGGGQQFNFIECTNSASNCCAASGVGGSVVVGGDPSRTTDPSGSMPQAGHSPLRDTNVIQQQQHITSSSVAVAGSCSDNVCTNLNNTMKSLFGLNATTTTTTTTTTGGVPAPPPPPIPPTIMMPPRQSLLPWGTHSRSSIINVLPPYTATIMPHMMPQPPIEYTPEPAASVTSSGTSTSTTTSSSSVSACASMAPPLRPGEIVMRNLFSDFTVQAEKKIELVMLESVDKTLSKLLQRGEDQQFDQLMSALGCVAEHCLPSLLHTLLAWHRRQLSDGEIKNDLKRLDSKQLAASLKPPLAIDLEFQLQRREAAVEFIFCLALIEILKQLPFHPGHEDLIRSIEYLAFKHFKYKEGLQNNPNAHNIHMIADLYAEVIGVLAQSRFASVRKRFMSELKELRAKEPSPTTTQSIISLLMGMKFFRVKMVPIEEFEASFQFMHECGQYFLEVKDKDIKHALAGLFVEILVPVAAAVKNEVNVPCVKNFVELLYVQTLDASTKSKHRLALFPLVTCLLCVSQKTFFLSNWHYFLAMCLSNLKNRDSKMSRVALESLYRLLWVYMIRIKCESNSATHSRLQSIVNSLFPKGSKGVVPRDTPLNIFVKIIQFIAQERLDFAMREIVYDLLCVGRSIKLILNPERMSIGLRAFLVVADSLQQKDGEPPMPRTVPVLPSGNTLRVKKTYLNKMLTDDTARSIGMSTYFPHVRRVFVDILRALDVHYGRPLMMTNTQNQNKEPDEMLSGERKPRIDLFRTCVAAVPRLIPDTMTAQELVDLLSRLTVHMDEELRMLTHQSLQTLVIDFPDWRRDVVHGYTQFLVRDVTDTYPQLLENCTRMLFVFLNIWRCAINVNGPSGVGANGPPNGPAAPNANATLKTNNNATAGGNNTNAAPRGGAANDAQGNANAGAGMIGKDTATSQLSSASAAGNAKGGIHTSSSGTSSIATTSSGMSSLTQNTVIHLAETAAGAAGKRNEIPLATTLHFVEGFALVLLCNYRPFLRKLAAMILKEAKNLMKALGIPETEPPVIDVIDKCCSQVLERCLPHLPQAEKTAILNANVIDLQWIAERNSAVWMAGYTDDTAKSSTLNLTQPGGSQQTGAQQAPPQSQQFDPWSIVLLGFFERSHLLQQCPSAMAQAWPICYSRVATLYSVIDPTPVNDNRASLLRSSAPTKKVPTESQKDLYLRLWRNQVACAMRLVPQIPSVAVRCASPDLSLSLQDQSDSRSLSDSLDNIPSNVFGPEGIVTRFTLPLSYGRKEARQKRLGSSPDSLNADRSDKSAMGSASPQALYKLVVPLLRCEVVDVRDAAVNAIGMINHDALKDLMEELVVYIREAVDRKQENMRRRRRRDALRLQLVRVLEKIAENGTFGVSVCVLERDTMSLHPTFVEYIEGAMVYLVAETDKDNISIREVKAHFCNFIRKMIKNFSLESCATLLTRDLKRNLFKLFATWSGAFAKPLGIASQIGQTGDEEKLQFSALQAMSALVCCGHVFCHNYLTDDGVLYKWLDMLLTSKDEKIYQLARDTVVLLLESNPDVGQLLEWVIDRCYTSTPREADACFLALASIFSAKEYPCDHYTSVITVTLLMTGCPRTEVHSSALQLLQILDKRFFGNVGPLHSDTEREDDKVGTLDVLLSNAYCRSQRFLSKQLAQLRPELTMSMFSEITNRFQSGREDVRTLLLQCLLPWLQNMELVATSVPPATPLSYIMYFPDSGTRGRREGTGSTEATEMILNNLFYITAKFSDTHPRDIEELWGTLCQFWPNNLKVILRYLVIMSGMAPNELLPYAKRVALYLARTCPDRLLDELMAELQTVETLNCLIERTETPPFYRLTSMRKASSHSADGQPAGMNDSRLQDLAVEKGTIHTKRHSGEDPIKTGTCKSDSGIRAFTQAAANRPPRGADKIRAASGPSILPRPEDILINDPDLRQEENVELRSSEAPTAPHPLPMPEYGGYFAPLTEFLPDVSLPISGFHRCNVAVMLLTDIVVDGIPGIDWTLHLPLMLHILFLGLDHTRVIVREHCKQLCLNLLIVLAEHNDHLTVARILLNSETSKLDLGLTVPALPVIDNNFTESHQEFDSYLLNVNPYYVNPMQHCLPIHNNTATTASSNNAPILGVPQQSAYHNVSQQQQMTMHNMAIPSQQQQQQPQQQHVNLQQPPPLSQQQQQQQPGNLQINPNTSENSEVPLISSDENAPPQPGPTMPIAHVIKALVKFLSQQNSQPLWNYEDITAKVWTVKSADQLTAYLRHMVKVFADSYPQARIAERWAQTALQLGLSCSSRHYAGRCLQIFRALNVPINSRMLSDILSRLVETVAEQGEDMQGYVTELLLTLEAAVDSLDSDFRPLDVMKDIFKSTPNLNNKDGGGPNSILAGKKSPCGIAPHSPNFSVPSHARSTSYSVSYCARKCTNSPCDKPVELRNRSSGIDMERSVTKFGGSALSRSRSAQSLKMLGDTATQDDKMTILAQLFWLSVSLLESDYEHEFLLALRLLTRVLHRLPLDRPDARDKVEKLQQQLKWSAYPGVHALLLKGCTHSSTYEPTIALLSQFAPLLSLPVCDPTQSCAFPMNVISLLPYMLLHYEDANEICIRSAENIAHVSSELGAKLENLGTVMTLYSRKTFCKESFQWTKCVVKYLHDTYAHMGLHMLAFLIEVLEKGPQQIQVPVLNVIHCMLHYVDLSAPQAQTINSDLLRAIGKYLDTVNWRDSLKILKLIVTRSSSLQVVPPSDGVSAGLSFPFYGAYPDSDMFCKKELAGRTMEFTFDVSQTPLIGRRILLKSEDGLTEMMLSSSSSSSMATPNAHATQSAANASSGSAALNAGNASGHQQQQHQMQQQQQQHLQQHQQHQQQQQQQHHQQQHHHQQQQQSHNHQQQQLRSNSSYQWPHTPHLPNSVSAVGTPNSPRRSASLSPADSVPLSGWKRPWLSQGRVREGLVNLLTTCGQRVGLPKSPSVIFSQSSDLMERQSSAASSTEETSGPQGDLSSGSRRDDGQPDFTVFKDFDFLEYEDSIAGESTDNFNWGVRRHQLFEGDEERLSLGGATLGSGAGGSIKGSLLSGWHSGASGAAGGGGGTGAAGGGPMAGGHSSSAFEDSFSDRTPLSKRRRHLADDSSDEEAESESPLDEDHHRQSFMKGSGGGPPTSLSLRERRRRNSVSRSDTSGSSAGDLGDITPCNASPHLPGIIRFGGGIRDEAEENWRKQLQAMLVNQPSAHTSELLLQLYRLIKELTFKTISISKESKKFFTGIGSQLGNRISLFTDLLSSRADPPRVWCCDMQATAPRLFETLRFNVLEVQEHLETFFDRKDQVLECLDNVKSSCKLSLFNETDVAAAGMDLVANVAGGTAIHSSGASNYMPFDPASAEVVLDLGRALYKLMFQLLLLIESNHKISSNVVNHFRLNETMHDISDLYALVRDALVRSVSEADLDLCLDTSTSTEGEHTPTPSPGLPMTTDEFDSTLQELIDGQKWSAAIAHVRQYKRISQLTASNPNLTIFTYSNLDSRLKFDELSIILNAYAQSVMKDRAEAFIVSKSDSELFEVYAILSENLYHVSSALTTMEINMKCYAGGGGGGIMGRLDNSDIVTNL